jgi:hypothetical protein
MPTKKSPKKKGEISFKNLLDNLDDVPDDLRMKEPEIKYFSALQALLICPEFYGDASKFKIPEGVRPTRFSHPTVKTALTNMEELIKQGKKINRDQMLELWDFCGDMAQDGDVSDESDSEASDSDCESEDEKPAPKKRGRPKGSTKKKSA